jgi:hypothetical protein
VAVVLHVKHSAWLLAALLVVAPSKGEEKRETESEEGDKKPFILPTYSGEKTSHHAPPKPKPAGPFPEPREIYDYALRCWPAPSYMRAEVSLEGRAQNVSTTGVDETGAVRFLGRNSAALVARIPLFSATELDREREREYTRRTKLADSVGNFITALTDRHKTNRELELMRALEKRSQKRVQIGVTDTSEQVQYLQKVVTLEGELVKQRGMLEKSRLELIGHCRADEADGMDRYLQQFIEGK